MFFAHLVVSWLKHGFEQEEFFHSLYAHIQTKRLYTKFVLYLLFIFIFIFILKCHLLPEKRFRNGRPVAQDVARYLPNCLAASICRRIASSELHAAGAYRHGERQEVQRQGGHGRRLAFNLHVNGSPHPAGETYRAFTFRRCMHARLIHRSLN